MIEGMQAWHDGIWESKDKGLLLSHYMEREQKPVQ